MLETIAQYREAQEAYLAKGVLANEGIEAVIADEQVVGINWLYSNAIGGVKLAVKSESAERALDALKPQPVDEDVQGRPSRGIRSARAVGIVSILLLAAWVLPILVIALPIIAMSRRRDRE